MELGAWIVCTKVYEVRTVSLIQKRLRLEDHPNVRHSALSQNGVADSEAIETPGVPLVLASSDPVRTVSLIQKRLRLLHLPFSWCSSLV